VGGGAVNSRAGAGPPVEAEWQQAPPPPRAMVEGRDH